MKKLNCILLIEDNNLTNLYNQKVIDQMNVAECVVVVEDGQEGLDYIYSHGKYAGRQGPKPELIFLDINMPRMNGWEFLEEYNNRGGMENYEPVIVMLTSSPNPDDARMARSYPEVKGFSKKPLTRQVIQDIINEFF